MRTTSSLVQTRRSGMYIFRLCTEYALDFVYPWKQPGWSGKNRLPIPLYVTLDLDFEADDLFLAFFNT